MPEGDAGGTRGQSPTSNAGPAPQTVIAFDFGTRRIGVAVGNSLTGSADPLAIIEDESSEARFRRIAALIAEWRPDRLVVGRPAHPDGSPHEMTARCERFARQLHGRHGLPVDTVDERYSSVEARADLDAGPRRERGRRDDAVAAAIILRQYFDEHRTA